jgi:acetyl-CoA acetyltransferase
MTDVERRAVISGIGQSAVGRRLGRSGIDLTIDAALEAIADAGLTPADIDGLATYPGATQGPAGFSGPGSPEVQDALRLELSWHRGGIEGAAQLSAVVDAVMAVAAGLARHVLVYRTVTESTAQGSGGRQGIGTGAGGGGGGGKVPRMGGTLQWTIPFRAYSAANWLALNATRHFHEFGTTPEQLAMIAINGRRNAGRNPKAVYRDPMTLDDYFAARMITTPFRLYDCDAPVDGSTALVVSHAGHARAVDHPVARVEAVGTALRGRPSWDQFDDLTTMAARDAGAHLWSRTDLTPADVDVAELYDGFSFLAMTWLEALGFCGRGESGPFIEGGDRIALDGELPLNTHGGQLSAGRLHGFGFVHEACVQLRGEGGERQVPKPVEVAVVANGGGPLAGAMLLTREA